MKPTVEILGCREVPLGGIRALTVRRTLPHRDRPFIGAWCFVDHYGPTPVVDDDRDGMDVPPHPHAGLQTVSWLFEGEIEHRDSGGVVGLVRPGEMNLMTAGYGVAHSEVSTPATRALHGVQLWIVLPEGAKDVERGFEHFAPERVELPEAGSALVFLGTLRGVGASPVRSHSPILGAQLDLDAGARLRLELDRGFEHGVLLDSGSVAVEGECVLPGQLACVDAGADHLDLAAGDDGARVILLGGEPFDEPIIMWWNLIGRTHEEIVELRSLWEAESGRFGTVPGYSGPTMRIPAPPMPPVRLKPRTRRAAVAPRPGA